MAQAFQTIYNRNYRKHPFCKRDLIKPIDEFAEKPPSEGNWRIVSKDDSKTQGRSRRDLEEQVAMVYSKRHRTTYFTSYCHDEAKDTFHDSDEECSNELINRGKRVFKKKIKKISPPLATSRRLWGYMRPESLYAPLSTYQNEHDLLAFNLLKDGPPKEDYLAVLEEHEENEKQRVKDDLKHPGHDPVNGLDESTDLALKPKLNKLDGLSKKYKKKHERQTLSGKVCGELYLH